MPTAHTGEIRCQNLIIFFICIYEWAMNIALEKYNDLSKPN